MIVYIVEYPHQFIKRAINSTFNFNAFVVGARHIGLVNLDPVLIAHQGPIPLGKGKPAQEQPEEEEDDICEKTFHCVFVDGVKVSLFRH